MGQNEARLLIRRVLHFGPNVHGPKCHSGPNVHFGSNVFGPIVILAQMRSTHDKYVLKQRLRIVIKTLYARFSNGSNQKLYKITVPNFNGVVSLKPIYNLVSDFLSKFIFGILWMIIAVYFFFHSLSK